MKSVRGTQFRQWATQRIKDFFIEGVAINEKRLEQKNKEIQVLHDGPNLHVVFHQQVIAKKMKWISCADP